MCVKFSDNVQERPATDFGSLQNYSVFLDYYYHVDMAMSKVPAKRFTFKANALAVPKNNVPVKIRLLY